ncbi:MAG: GNAT family N-acetyltransferase [Candidatus Bathyarchaeia archaeon]|nr:GNAT family N-acetyltransferase [Candidatus Bathyarchaeia archaeon]
MNVSFRDYKPGDEEAYVYIWNEASKTCSWYRKHGPATVNGIRKNIEKNRKDSTYRLIFAISEKRLVGFIEARMKDAETGEIFPYRPCVLPIYRQQSVDKALVETAFEHLRKCGARKVRFSIMGVAGDTTPYIDLYLSLGFQIWRKAQSMRRNFDNIPDCTIPLPLKLLTARQVGIDAFVYLFIECFQDSNDRDASQIAS